MLPQLARGFERFNTCGLPPRSLVASAMNRAVRGPYYRVRQRRLLLACDLIRQRDHSATMEVQLVFTNICLFARIGFSFCKITTTTCNR
jgi:hypothetical protein